MRALFRLFSWRHFRRHGLRLLLCLLSITLGVALFVAMEVSHASTVHAFETAARRLRGRAEFAVTRKDRLGIEAAALARIEAVPGVLAAPVVQVTTTFPDLEEGAILLLGVDFLREARLRHFAPAPGTRLDFLGLLVERRAVVIPRALARRNGLRLGEHLRMTTPHGLTTVRIAGILADRGAARVLGGNLALMHVEAVQALFDRQGRYDRIDVARAGKELIGERLRRRLGGEYRLQPVGARSGILEIVLHRLRALVAVSVIALLVGLFIIYLTVSIGVVERAREIGALRALGASRGQILTVLLVEGGALGVAGSLAGIWAGYGLALWVTRISVKSVNILVHLVEVQRVLLPRAVIVEALAAGTATALLAALFPTLRATRISPLEALRPPLAGVRSVPDYRRAFALGALLFAAAAAGILGFYFRVPLWAGLAFTALAFLAIACMLPQVTIWTSLAVRTPLRFLFRVEGFLAAVNLLQYPQRTALTVTALGGALAMLVAAAATLTSFHVSVRRWMNFTFPFHLSIWPASIAYAIYTEEALPPHLEKEVRRIPGVACTYTLRFRFQEFRGRQVLLLGVDMRGFLAAKRLLGDPFRGVLEDPRELRAYLRGETVGISKNFGVLYGVSVGDRLTLRTARGRHPFRVAWEIEDYSYPLGTVFVDRHVYAELWRDRALSYLDVVAAPGTDLEALRREIGRVVARTFRAFVYRREDIVAYGLAALDQSFELTRVQVIVAMVIGFFGIVNTLLISVLHRVRDIGLLRAAGMSRTQVAGSVVVEAVFVALVGGVCGVVWGLVAAAFPVAYHIVRLSGFTLPFLVPWPTVGLALGAAVVLGFLAGMLPARRAAAVDVLRAIQYE